MCRPISKTYKYKVPLYNNLFEITVSKEQVCTEVCHIECHEEKRGCHTETVCVSDCKNVCYWYFTPYFSQKNKNSISSINKKSIFTEYENRHLT